jgi:peptidoglycan/LPS O-acetylase OafA/YrhL
MFGAYRYVLALMVASGHIQFQLFGRPNWLGLYAVFGFYTLSGYLMTRVLHETYGYHPRGFVAYLSNRALRIYPPYWVALGVSITMLCILPDAPGKAAWLVYLPTSVEEYLRNFALIGMSRGVRPALVPPVWSLHVEIIFYILMGLGVSSTRRFAFSWLAVSVAWTAWAVWSAVPFGDRYSTVLAGSVAFSAGACTYFCSAYRARWMWIAVAAFLPHALVAPFLWGDVYTEGFYASFLLVPFCILALAGWRAPAAWARWDRRLGDLSYPIFLLHTQCGYLAPRIAPFRVDSTLDLFLVALPLMHLAGILIDLGVVRPLERVRSRFRARAIEGRA